MKVICNDNKKCPSICLDGTICSHSTPHEHYYGCDDAPLDDSCTCTNKAYQIYCRKEKLEKLNEK